MKKRSVPIPTPTPFFIVKKLFNVDLFQAIPHQSFSFGDFMIFNICYRPVYCHCLFCSVLEFELLRLLLGRSHGNEDKLFLRV